MEAEAWDAVWGEVRAAEEEQAEAGDGAVGTNLVPGRMGTAFAQNADTRNHMSPGSAVWTAPVPSAERR